MRTHYQRRWSFPPGVTSWPQAAVLTALQSAHGPLTVAQIHRRVADDDRALARRTIDVALVALRSAGLVARAEARPGLAARWSVTPAPENRAEEDR